MKNIQRAQHELTAKPYIRKSYAVWEITLKCNLACSHCGSRAGDKRQNELTTLEALDLARQLAELGIQEVTLIGGEAYLRPDWLMIASEITRLGMKSTMTTGGYGISQGTAKRMKQSGITTVSVSVDGLELEHDRLRGKDGSWRACFNAIKHLKQVGIVVGVNTQINRETAKHLPLLYQLLVEAGVSAWQLQLTVPMGNAADNSQILLQPVELLDLFPILYYLSLRGRKDGLIIQPGNNIGYFGPYERVLRGAQLRESKWAFYKGCRAGIDVIGIEADGSIKGCPSLPTKAYSGGNIRNSSLKKIYLESEQLAINEVNDSTELTKDLWGHCKTCEFASTCRGGCHWTSHVFFGKRGNNPYCHHRVLKLAIMGKKERFYLAKKADGKPFDHGLFELLEEDIGPLDPYHMERLTINNTIFPQSWIDDNPRLKQSLYLERGLSMKRYVDAGVVNVNQSPWYQNSHQQTENTDQTERAKSS